MLYSANPAQGSPAPLQGEAHPEDTARAVAAIRDLIYSEKPVNADVAPPACSDPIPESPPQPDEEAPAPQHTRKSLRLPLPSFQPDWRLSGAILLLAIMIWKPLLLPGVIALTLAVAAIAYFSLGPDRVQEGVVRWHARLQRRNPERAEQVRARANRISARLERWAGYLPDRWTNGLYFPTFDAEPDEDDLLNDPFQRLMPQERL